MMSTQTLTMRARTLLNRLGQVREQEQDADARNAVERARSRARGSREALSEVVRSIPAIRDRQVTLPVVSETMRTQVITARTTLRRTATSIMAADSRGMADHIGRKTVDQALDVAEKCARFFVTELNKSVDRKRTELLPRDINLPISPFPGVSDSLVAGLQVAQLNLQSKVEGLAVEHLVQRLDRIIEQVERWTKDRPRLDDTLGNQDPEIKEFLRLAVTHEGAPWRLITPRVQAWLAVPEHTTALRVVLRS